MSHDRSVEHLTAWMNVPGSLAPSKNLARLDRPALIVRCPDE
jgi:hypothetical protein